MKKIVVALSTMLFLLVAAIIVLPILFKDDIQKAIDEAIEQNINAVVYYDVDGIEISLIRSFPDLSVVLKNFGIAGKTAFEKDTLLDVGSFGLTVDLMSVITGDQIVIEEISLDQPAIFVRVLPDGEANYDIAKATGTDEIDNDTGTTDESALSISINRWAISDGSFIYSDESINFYISLQGLEHEGNGDFTLDVFDLTTETTIRNLSLGMEGIDYLSNKKLQAKINLNMDLAAMKFTFLDNVIALNDFKMGAAGYVAMPDEEISMDIAFSGKEIDLKSMLSLIPGVYQEYLTGLEAGGKIAFNGNVQGSYSESKMPTVGSSLNIDEGFIKYADYPIPMEEISVKSNFIYTGDLVTSEANINKFHMLVDGEVVDAFLHLKNFVDYTWSLGLDGNLDLEKITKIFPLEGMTLKGKMNTSLKSEGKMSTLEAEKYEDLPTFGILSLSDFVFSSPDFPQGFEISSASLSFDPGEIKLSRFDSRTGSSDFQLKGSVKNYLGYALGKGQVLDGNLILSSSLVNADELIPAESSEDTTTTDTEEESLEVVQIPTDIDFVFLSSIEKLQYADYNISDFKGNISVNNGSIFIDESGFKMLGGKFGIIGSYSTKDNENPIYSFNLDIEDLSIAETANTFETVKQYAPIVAQATGKFSSELKIDGVLGSDMMPLMDKLNLEGHINIREASIEGGAFIRKLSDATRILGKQTQTSITIKEALIKTKIEDGRMYIDPFDLKIADYDATVSGNNGLDGSLDYRMKVRDVPTGTLGATVNQTINSLLGKKTNVVPENVDVNVGIAGNYDNPKINLLGSSKSASSGNTAKSSIKNAANAEVAKQKELVKKELAAQRKKAEAELEKQKKAAEEELEKQKKRAEDEAKRAVEEAKKKAEEEAKRAKEALKNKAKNFFKKKGGGC